jgi:hypothetical protein
MNPQYEQALEQGIDRELKSLGPMRAPGELRMRVMAAIASRQDLPAAAPQPWPIWARASLFFALAACFVAGCYGISNAPLPGALAEVRQSAGGVLNLISLVLGILQTLGSAVWMSLAKLGTPVLLGIVAATGLAYLAAVALGTVWYRLALDLNGETTSERNL